MEKLSLNHIAMGGTKESRNDLWGTPKALFDYYNAIWNFDLDAAADINNFKVANYLTEEDNALLVDWSSRGKRVWLNPPYSICEAFLTKAYLESRKGCVVVCLLPANTDSGWFHRWAPKAFSVRLLKGRVRFDPPPGQKKGSNPKGSAIFIFYGTNVSQSSSNIALWDWKGHAKELGLPTSNRKVNNDNT